MLLLGQHKLPNQAAEGKKQRRGGDAKQSDRR